MSILNHNIKEPSQIPPRRLLVQSGDHWKNLGVKYLCLAGFLLLLGCVHVKPVVTVNETPLSSIDIENRFIIPTTSAKNVIYLMLAQDTQTTYRLLKNQQIDWLNLSSTSAVPLFSRLLVLEITLRKMLVKNPNLMRAALYVGQAKDLVSRASGHKRELLNPVKQIQTTKGRWLKATLKKYSVEMSYLVKNIPPEYLNVVECLVGHLFAVQDFKGSAKLGNTKSWEQIIKYFSWPQRLDTLEKLNLLHEVEVKREEIREMILPFRNPWHL